MTYAPPRKAALRWFNLQRDARLTTQEDQALAEWLGADPAHRAEHKRIEQAWTVAGAMEDHPAIRDICEAVDQKLQSGKRLRAAGMIAAGLALTTAAGVGALRSGIVADWGAEPQQEYRTDVGERREVTLSDGSHLTLDTNTILRTRMSMWDRRITLERGQASFEVAKDRSRPFIVGAAGMSVRATGTVFDVRAEAGRFEVTLIEGRVRVQKRGQETEDAPMANMQPGWRLAIGDDARWRMEPVDLVRETSWHDGVLTFHEESLERAAAEMNRYSRRQIVVSGAASSKVIFGHFRAGDVESFAKAAELNKVARVVSRTDERIELTTR